MSDGHVVCDECDGTGEVARHGCALRQCGSCLGSGLLDSHSRECSCDECAEYAAGNPDAADATWTTVDPARWERSG